MWQSTAFVMFLRGRVKGQTPTDIAIAVGSLSGLIG
jgi:hypothetical protein